MKKLNVLLLVIFSMLLNAKTNAQTAVLSSGMSIQGIARDNSNQALANMDQDLVFTVYYFIGASTTPTVIQTRTATVKTDNFGVFSYVFVIDQAQFNLISSNSSYLKVSNSASVVFSDEKLQTVPYAIYAQNGVPTGSIMPFIGTVAPNGWLLCDGNDIPSGTYYDNLKTLAGAKTPDLRGMFLRGTGSATGYTGKTGPSLKVVQADANLEHNHGVSAITTSSNGAHDHNAGSNGYVFVLRRDGTGTAQGFDDNNGGGTEPTIKTAAAITSGGSHSHTLSGATDGNGTTESRPINYGVNYIIKL